MRKVELFSHSFCIIKTGNYGRITGLHLSAQYFLILNPIFGILNVDYVVFVCEFLTLYELVYVVACRL